MTIKERYDYLMTHQDDDISELDDAILKGFEFDIFSDSESNKKFFEEHGFEKVPKDVDEISDEMLDEIQGELWEREEEFYKKKYQMQRGERGYSDSDAWNIYSWFLEVMPKALQQMRDDLHSFPDSFSAASNNSKAVETDEEEDSPGLKAWKEKLDRMIFLLHEMDEEDCSLKNPYQEEYDKANEEFAEKYGMLGERFEDATGLVDEESSGRRVYFFSDDPDHPEWKELSRKYFNFEQYKALYRDKCREEFFYLFSMHFWDLWD